MTTRFIRTKAHEKEISLRYLALAVLFWLLTFSWIVVIFYLSNQNANDSSELSHIFLNLLNELFNTTIQDDSVIRMLAHSSEFAFLTVLSYVALSSTNKISNFSREEYTILDDGI